MPFLENASESAASASWTTPHKFNPNRCTKTPGGSSATAASPYRDVSSCSAAPAAGLTYEVIQKKSEHVTQRHVVPNVVKAHSVLTPSELPPASERSAKKLFMREKLRESDPQPERIKHIEDTLFRTSTDLFGATVASLAGSTAASGTSLSSTRNGRSSPNLSSTAGRPLSRATQQYHEALQKRVAREGIQLGIGNATPAPHQTKAYKVVTPYARDD